MRRNYAPDGPAPAYVSAICVRVCECGLHRRFTFSKWPHTRAPDRKWYTRCYAPAAHRNTINLRRSECNSRRARALRTKWVRTARNTAQVKGKCSSDQYSSRIPCACVRNSAFIAIRIADTNLQVVGVSVYANCRTTTGHQIFEWEYPTIGVLSLGSVCVNSLFAVKVLIECCTLLTFDR